MLGEFDPLTLSNGAYEAAGKDSIDNPAGFDETWAELSRINPQLALSILDSAKDAYDSDIPGDEIYIHSTLRLMRALLKSVQTGEQLDVLADYNTESFENVRDLPQVNYEGKKTRRRHWRLWRVGAAAALFSMAHRPKDSPEF